jgi:hypothetical protein
MSKMSELDLCVGELRNAVQSLTAVADSLTALFSGGNSQPEQKVSPATTGSKPKAEPKPITLEQVRAVLAEKSRNGHTADVRALLEAHGAAKLSAIDPKEYPALLAEGSRIGLTATPPDGSGGDPGEGGANG